MASNSTTPSDHHRVNQNADSVAQAEIEAQRSWERRKAQRRAEVWHLNNVAEKDVADRIAAIREARAEWEKFKRDQRTANDWISFDRALRCLIGQKDIATSQQATSLLLDDIRAGKFNRQNANTSTLTAIIGPGSSAPDEAKGVYWTPADVGRLLNAEIKIEMRPILAEIHFAHEPLMTWMNANGFTPPTDFALSPVDETHDDNGAKFSTIKLPIKPPTERVQAIVHRVLLEMHAERKMRYPESMLALTQQINRKLDAMRRAGLIDEGKVISRKTVERYVERIAKRD
jgi:hypothetical protein